MRLPGRYDGVARPIVTYGSDPVLHRAVRPRHRLRRGAAPAASLDMFASMDAADGVGLAANQIGVDARIFVIDCPDADGRGRRRLRREPGAHAADPPRASRPRRSPRRAACRCPAPTRSCPGPSGARVDGVDVDGEPVTIEATGMAGPLPAARGGPPRRHGLRRPAARGAAGAAARRGGRARAATCRRDDARGSIAASEERIEGGVAPMSTA